MEMNDFIKDIADQFDDTELSQFTPATNFRELEEWSSLIAFAVLSIIEKKYAQINVDELRQVNSIQELYELVISKKIN